MKLETLSHTRGNKIYSQSGIMNVGALFSSLYYECGFQGNQD